MGNTCKSMADSCQCMTKTTAKYLGINLTKEASGLYTENYKTSVKTIGNRNKWKHSVFMK